MAITISRGARSRPQKIVIYGPEGVGKTTIASAFPDPLFADCEGGTDHIDLARTDVKSIGDFRETCMHLIREPHDFKSFIVDTVDWLAAQDVAEMLKDDGVDSVEDYGYGKGYKKAEERFISLLHLLDRVQRKGIHVVLLGHSKVTKFEEPDKGGSYDRYSLKLEKKIEPLVKEWCDALLFMNYETKIVEREKGSEKKRGKSTGKRLLHCAREAAFDAKNRHGLPDKVEATIKALKPILECQEVSPETVEKLEAALTPKVEAGNDAEKGEKLGKALDEQAQAAAEAEPCAEPDTRAEEHEKALAEVVKKAGGKEAVNAFLATRKLSIETLDANYAARVLKAPDTFSKQVAEHSRSANASK